MTTLNDKIYAKLVEVGKKEKQKRKQPFYFLKLVITIFAIIIVVSFDEYCDYKNYQKYFQTYPKSEVNFQKFEDKLTHIYPKNNTYASTRRYYPDISLSNQYLRLKFGGVSGFLKGNIDIPSSAVLGCSPTLDNRGNAETFIVLKQNELGLNIQGIPSLKDWCFNNHLPLFTSKEINDWRYSKKPLPNPSSIQERVSSKTEYEAVLKQANMCY